MSIYLNLGYHLVANTRFSSNARADQVQARHLKNNVDAFDECRKPEHVSFYAKGLPKMVAIPSYGIILYRPGATIPHEYAKKSKPFTYDDLQVKSRVCRSDFKSRQSYQKWRTITEADLPEHLRSSHLATVLDSQSAPASSPNDLPSTSDVIPDAGTGHSDVVTNSPTVSMSASPTLRGSVTPKSTFGSLSADMYLSEPFVSTESNTSGSLSPMGQSTQDMGSRPSLKRAREEEA